jgi:hypothetical protein
VPRLLTPVARCSLLVAVACSRAPAGGATSARSTTVVPAPASAAVASVSVVPSAAPSASAQPPFETDFANLDGWEPRTPLGSVVTAQRAGARDGQVVELRYPGDPALGPADRVGPVRWPVELRTQEPLHYGEYRLAVELARCAASEELVNGIFVYANDGQDHDGNGIVDNAEIDVEILCSAPHLYWMTVWTDYQPGPHGARFQKQTRLVDLRSGRYRETPPGKEGTYETRPAGVLPEAVDPSFPEPKRFYELGFEWRPEFVRYFVRRGEADVTLWKLERQERIPVHPARFMLNVWHSRRHWLGGAEADYPARDGVMRVDWFRYRPAPAQNHVELDIE